MQTLSLSCILDLNRELYHAIYDHIWNITMSHTKYHHVGNVHEQSEIQKKESEMLVTRYEVIFNLKFVVYFTFKILPRFVFRIKILLVNISSTLLHTVCNNFN